MQNTCIYFGHDYKCKIHAYISAMIIFLIGIYYAKYMHVFLKKHEYKNNR